MSERQENISAGLNTLNLVLNNIVKAGKENINIGHEYMNIREYLGQKSVS